MQRTLGILALLALGYALGATGTFHAQPLAAQPAADLPSGETISKIKAANDALFAAAADLRAEDRYRTATTGTNAFAVLVGGVDAVDDLETGRGVDPHTFAALYAGQATEEIAPDIGRDPQGRLTYKDRVIKMYPVERLKKLFAKQQRLLDTR